MPALEAADSETNDKIFGISSSVKSTIPVSCLNNSSFDLAMPSFITGA